MRKVIPLVALLLIGCMNSGTIRRKPGSDVVLPATPNLSVELLRNVLCLTVPTPGVTTTIGTATTPTTSGAVPGAATGAATGAAAQCSLTARRDSVPDPRATLRPPIR